MSGRPARTILWTSLRLATGAMLLAMLVRSGAIDWSALLGLAARWPVTLAAFAFLTLDSVATAWRFCVLLRPSGLGLSLAASIRLTLIAMFFNTCLPGAVAGDFVRMYYAGGRGADRIEIATIVLFDRAVGLFGLLMCPLLVAPFFWPLIVREPVLTALLSIAAVAAIGMLAGFFVLCSRTVRQSRPFAALLTRIPFSGYIEAIVDTLELYSRRWRVLLSAAGIAMVGHAFGVLAVLLIARATNPAASNLSVVFLTAFGFLANNLPLTPGGLGVGEAAFDRLFSLAGLTGGAAAMLGWRLLTILQGLIGLGIYLQGRQAAIVRVESVPLTTETIDVVGACQ